MRHIPNTFTIILLGVFVACNNASDKQKSMPSDALFIDSQSIAEPDSVVTRIGIKMTKRGGVYELPCEVNGVKMNFIFDTGASSVCLSLTEALFLYKNGYLDDTDFIGESYSRIADGSIVENMEIMLNSIKIDETEINNVKATVVNSLDAPLLLGLTAIQEYGRIEFSGDSLFITEKKILKDTNNSSSNLVVQTNSNPVTNKGFRLFGRKKSQIVEQYLLEAINAMDNDMPELAKQNCHNAISEDSKDWRPYALLGILYDDDENDHLGDAITQYEKSMNNNTERESYSLGDINLSWLGTAEKLARNYLQTTLRSARYDKTKLDAAIKLAQQILLSYPDNEAAMAVLSRAYARLGEFAIAEKWAAKLKSFSESSGLFSFAFIYGQQGRTSESIKAYIKCLELDPDNTSAMNNLANQYSTYFQDNESWTNGKYYYSYNKTDYYWEAVRLQRKAARLGNTTSQNWLRRRELDW